MASETRTGALLRALASSKPSGLFLELGTGTGAGTAWILDGMDSASQLVTVDVEPRFQQVARDALGEDPRLILMLEDGLGFLERQSEGSFDFVFADAMPGKYDNLEGALRLVRPGGYYVIDDMLPQSNWPEGHGLKVQALLLNLANRRDWTIAPMSWASGVVVAVRKPLAGV
jgi:predicted O-methyltransferase YrrM